MMKQKIFFLLSFLVVTSLLGLLFSASTRYFSPDSWAFLDVANGTTLNGIGRIEGTRDFENSPWINDSFPFGFPLTQWVLKSGLGLSWELPIGVFTSLFFALLTFCFASHHLRKLGLPLYVAPLFMLALFSIPELVNDAIAGRSHWMATFLLVASLFILIDENVSGFQAFVSGAMLGALSLTRFDSLLYGPVICLVFAFYGRLKLKEASLTILGWSIGPMLWSAYSLVNFGKLYSVDSGHIAKSQSNIRITDYPTKEIENQIGISLPWMEKVLHNFSGATQSANNFYSWLILPICVSILIFIIWKQHNNYHGLNAKNASKDSANIVLVVAGSIFVITFLQQSLTAYLDARYWILSAVALVLSLSLRVATNFHLSDHSYPKILITVLALIGVLSIAPAIDLQTKETSGSQFASISDCLKDAKGSTLVFDHNLSAGIAASTGLRTVMMPSNFREMSQSDWGRLVSTYDVSNVLYLNGSNEDRNIIPKAIASINCNY
jgi:hypothetical protein